MWADRGLCLGDVRLGFAIGDAETHQWLERSDQAQSTIGQVVEHLDRRRRHHGSLNEPGTLQLLETLRQQSVRDTVHMCLDVPEATVAPSEGEEDRAVPSAADELDDVLEGPAGVVVDRRRVWTVVSEQRLSHLHIVIN